MIIEYLRLTRVQSAAFTATAVLIGYLIAINEPKIIDLCILFIIGILAHIFIFILNEYSDLKVDSKSKYLKNKPLVSGKISKNHALYIAAIACIISYALTIFLNFSFFTLLFLSMIFLLGGLYDFLGKKIAASDLLISGSSFFLCLFGASIVSVNFSILVYLISTSIFFYILFNNAISGGLKDIQTDFLAGAKTTATRLGVKVKDERIVIPFKFIILSILIKTIYVSLILFASFQPDINFWQNGLILAQLLSILIVVLICATLFRFLRLLHYDRKKIIRLLEILAVLSYYLALVVLFPIFGFVITLILFLSPALWFIMINFILYGNLTQPQV